MRILATADLHGREDWLKWLAVEAHNFDLLVIAGDLIDRGDDVINQIEMVFSWTMEISKIGVPLLLCSGNHEAFPLPLESPWKLEFDAMLAGIQEDSWLNALPYLNPRCCANGTRYYADHHLVVSSLPFGAADNTYLRVMNQGRHLLKEYFEVSPLWIVAHHVPPIGNLADHKNGSPELASLLELYQPHLVFTGHCHGVPLRSGCCIERHGYTRVFNPGADNLRDIPCHIAMDTRTFRYQWHR